MRTLYFVFMFVLFSLSQYTEIIPLHEIVNAERMLLDENQMYISGDENIYIYSLGNFKLTNKFGKMGGGPGEFIIQPPVPLIINLSKDNILASSRGKISLFTKSGKFLKDIKTEASLVFFQKSLGDKFAGFGITRGEDNKFYRTINIYSSMMKKIKELCRILHDFQAPGQGYNVFVPWAYTTHNKLVYIPWRTEFCIDIFDYNGNYLRSIKIPYKNIKVTGTIKNQFENDLKADPNSQQFFERMKPFHYPKYFPAILDIRVTDTHIYVFTYKNHHNKNECYVFGHNGNLISKTLVPLKKIDINSHYPFAIKDDKVFQIVETDDLEGWELHINRIQYK